ncbi:hypothetical protein AGMMS50262_09440 [Bacteroidia bacterium]|nr:hypothetical protein AGMMS50262_09440 [Bacteroidia bacterium]
MFLRVEMRNSCIFVVKTVSRYPQNQSKDLLKWLQIIPNKYLHFGDFDFAGIGIYLNEYKKHLGNKASFFIPENIEQILEIYGNKELYNNQKINFNEENLTEENLKQLIPLIHKYKKGLEQEIFIKESRLCPKIITHCGYSCIQFFAFQRIEK